MLDCERELSEHSMGFGNQHIQDRNLLVMAKDKCINIERSNEIVMTSE